MSFRSDFGTGLDVLVGVLSRPVTGLGPHRRWAWMTRLNIYMGVIVARQTLGFAIEPPGASGIAVTTECPEQDTAAIFLDRMKGFYAANLTLGRSVIGTRSQDDRAFLEAGVHKIVKENESLAVGAIPPKPHLFVDQSSLIAGLVQGLMCPGLDKRTIMRALNAELVDERQRLDAKRLAELQVIEEHLMLETLSGGTSCGANDNPDAEHNLVQPAAQSDIVAAPNELADKFAGEFMQTQADTLPLQAIPN